MQEFREDPLFGAGAKALPLCSYPTYPRYKGNGLPTEQASSYECAQP